MGCGVRVRDNKQVNQHVAATSALGRGGLPDDIGGAIALLLAPEAGWITGSASRSRAVRCCELVAPDLTADLPFPPRSATRRPGGFEEQYAAP